MVAGFLHYKNSVFAQTPTPTITLIQNYSPYSRLATDPINFACSFNYTSGSYSSLSYIILIFKFTLSSTVAAGDTTVATIYWNSSSNISNATTNISSSYSSRVATSKIIDNGSYKNYSITLGISTYTSTPNYYTLSDVGYYYCQLSDSTAVSTTGLLVKLSAYCTT